MKLYHLGASHPRKFISWDAVVQTIIARCDDTVNATTAANTTICEATLACILDGVDAHTAGRWSAGASILAFVPTITALMGNGVEDVIFVAEESWFLGVMCALCSSTLFAERFGSGGQGVQTLEGMVEVVEVQVKRAFAATANAESVGAETLASRRRKAIAGCALLLAAFGAGVWYAASVIWTQGVVVYSCPWTIHVPIWISLTQAIALVNIATLRWQYRHVEPIDLHQPEATKPNASNATTAKPQPKKQPWPRYIMLRHKQNSTFAKGARGATNILTFSLLAFATTVLGGMTMFTASEAVWCMALLAAAAGVSRLVGKWVADGLSGYRQTAVFDVQERHMDELRARVEGMIRSMRQSVV